MTMVRQGRRGLVTVIASACTALLLAGLAGCGSDAEAEAEESPRYELPTATPTPELTEPPWETDLTLSSAEKKAVDEAYLIVGKYSKAANDVTADATADPQIAMRYLSGRAAEDFEEHMNRMRSEGRRSKGYGKHDYHHVIEVSAATPEESTVQFSSCRNLEDFDTFDDTGKSLKNETVDPYVIEYTVTSAASTEWTVSNIESPGRPCD